MPHSCVSRSPVPRCPGAEKLHSLVPGQSSRPEGLDRAQCVRGEPRGSLRGVPSPEVQKPCGATLRKGTWPCLGPWALDAGPHQGNTGCLQAGAEVTSFFPWHKVSLTHWYQVWLRSCRQLCFVAFLELFSLPSWLFLGQWPSSWGRREPLAQPGTEQRCRQLQGHGPHLAPAPGPWPTGSGCSGCETHAGLQDLVPDQEAKCLANGLKKMSQLK